MIERKTLFVLGAGASMPFKHPSGADLYNEICSAGNGTDLHYGPVFAALAKECGVSPSGIEDFRTALTKSGANSIDTFLAYRPCFEKVGKLAIAYAIGKREYASCIGSDRKEHWYRYVWNKLHTGADTARELLNNKVKVITFNYDRTLEFFLFQAIANLYGIDDKEAMQALKSFKIEHVYGRAGGLGFGASGEPGRGFERLTRSADLLEAASSLRTIPELRTDDALFKRFRTWFDWADDVIVTGFSFDPLNCERLGFSSVIEWNEQQTPKKPAPRIFVSTLGMTGAEVEVAKNRLFRGESVQALPGTTLALLRHFAIFG